MEGRNVLHKNLQELEGLLLRAARNFSARGDYERAKRMLELASTLMETFHAMQELLGETDWGSQEARLRTRARRGEVTPIQAYREPILEALQALGGEATAQEVIERVFQQMQETLKPADLEQTPGSRLPRWKQHVYGARTLLKREGLLRSPGRGIWALTEKARKLLQREKSAVS